MRRCWGCLLVFMLMSCYALAYKDTKAILLANRDTQKDTIGYNLVSELARNVYMWVQSDQLTLWDTPEKKYSLKKTDLMGIESSNRTSFISLANIFIYEDWTSSRKKFKFNIKGIAFSDEGRNGDKVLYGYVEFNSAFRELLAKTPMHVNADGKYGMTLLQALMNKGYDFSLIYFDKLPLTDYKASARIVRSAMGSGKKKQLNHMPVPDVKQVEISVVSGPSQLSKNSDVQIKELEEFFNQNKQEFFNLGGDEILSYLKKSTIVITSFSIIESWTKDKSGKISYRPDMLVVYTVGLPLKPVSMEQIADWNIRINDRPFEDVLKERNYYYRVSRINGTIIPEDMTDTYKTALFSGQWNKIIPEEKTQQP